MLNHYIICCEKPRDNLSLIFDPSKGFELWKNNQLKNAWKMKITLIIKIK